MRRGACHRPIRGFTLVELLVVIFIIGLISGMAMLSLRSSGDTRVQDEARRLALVLGLAGQEALIQARPVGLLTTSDGYRFLIAGATDWEEVTMPDTLKPRTLPEGLSLSAGETPADEGEAKGPRPQVVFQPTGEWDPFAIVVSDRQGGTSLTVTGAPDGSVQVLDPTAKGDDDR